VFVLMIIQLRADTI